jgi:hypothetical protein
MVRFGTEVWTVCGEDSRKTGDETSGNEKVSKEGGSESDLSKVSDEFDCVKLG